MNFNLSTKEKFLLEDQKSHEQLCIQKYTTYANQASDPQLKNIFNNNAKQEQEHLNSINQLLNGQIPSMNNQQQSSMQSSQSQMQSGQQNMQSKQPQMQSVQMKPSMNQFPQSSNNSSQNGSLMSNRSDKDMCSDLLMTEKYVSNAYDTAIFEFSNPQVRNVLNHIQKEEQQHGESIFKYMESNGMYTVK
nr:spore coat protein [Sedimentibacter sp.]